jgi:chaperone required for assembly of F1-ATPase
MTSDEPSASAQQAQKPKRPGQEPMRPPLSKRLYTTIAVAPRGEGHTILLDGKSIHTPQKHALIVPTLALADAMAAEWRAQVGTIDPETMPLTRLANTAIDAVTAELAAVRADIVAFAGTDALCYRADAPTELIALQSATWDPVLAWAARDLGARLAVTNAIQHLPQTQAALDAIAQTVATFNVWQITALHVMTTLTGSAVLALAVGTSELTAKAAWSAAHVDEDWQAARWGADADAQTRRAHRWSQMEAAEKLLSTLR